MILHRQVRRDHQLQRLFRRAVDATEVVHAKPPIRSRAAFYTLKRFDLFSPMCIILIDGKAKSKKPERGHDTRARQTIRQSGGRADGTGR
jgi:hypothetical protein